MEKRRRIVVIGGSAAGPKAAAKARRIDNAAEVIILQKYTDLSMASCGYPYYVGGCFDDRNMLLSTPTGVTRNSLFLVMLMMRQVPKTKSFERIENHDSRLK
jgi:hypothetical protein